jgi:hypothetical protein
MQRTSTRSWRTLNSAISAALDPSITTKINEFAAYTGNPRQNAACECSRDFVLSGKSNISLPTARHSLVSTKTMF